MNLLDEKAIREQYAALIRRSGFPVTAKEWDSLEVNDFGLGNMPYEGFAFIDLLRSPRLRITLLALLPNQSLPQHVHPPYEEEQGKEETIRVISGETKVYMKGDATNPSMVIPEGKDRYYTARREILLAAGEQHTVAPGIEHWFQAGPEGSVNICFQNRVDENRNLFWDPASTGCPISPTDVRGAEESLGCLSSLNLASYPAARSGMRREGSPAESTTESTTGPFTNARLSREN